MLNLTKKNEDISIFQSSFKFINIWFCFFPGDAQNVMKVSFKYTKENFPDFKNKLNAKGWVTDRALLGADEWRIDIKRDL